MDQAISKILVALWLLTAFLLFAVTMNTFSLIDLTTILLILLQIAHTLLAMGNMQLELISTELELEKLSKEIDLLKESGHARE